MIIDFLMFLVVSQVKSCRAELKQYIALAADGWSNKLWVLKVQKKCIGSIHGAQLVMNDAESSTSQCKNHNLSITDQLRYLTTGQSVS